MNVRALFLVFFVTAIAGVTYLDAAQLKPTVFERRALLEYQVKLKFKGENDRLLRQTFLQKIQEACDSEDYVFEKMHELLDLIEEDLARIEEKKQLSQDPEHEQELEKSIQKIPEAIQIVQENKPVVSSLQLPLPKQLVESDKQVAENVQSSLPKTVIGPVIKVPAKPSGFWSWQIVRFFKHLFSDGKKNSKEIHAQEEKSRMLALERLNIQKNLETLEETNNKIDVLIKSINKPVKNVPLKKKKPKTLRVNHNQGPLQPVGLANFSGVNCYQNAVIQCLFHIPAFKNRVLEFEKILAIKQELKDIEEQNNKEFVDKFILLLKKMELGRSPQAKKINPDEFSSYAAQLFYPQKDVPYKYYQEDADDFLTYLLNEVTQSNFDKNHLLYNFFKVPQSKRTKCLGCNQSSFYKQAEFVLKIEIPDSKEKRPLTDCLSDFCAEQKLEGHEQYQCKNCISKQDALTCIKFNELSPLLIIQLKRFEFDKKEGKSSKKLTEVTFNPDALDMTPYLFSELEHEEVKQVDKNNYELVGVVLHRGTLEFGHYISFVRYPHENSQWIKCNDNKVTLKRDRTLNNLAKTGTYTDSHGFLFYPYLFFYQKKV